MDEALIHTLQIIFALKDATDVDWSTILLRNLSKIFAKKESTTYKHGPRLSIMFKCSRNKTITSNILQNYERDMSHVYRKVQKEQQGEPVNPISNKPAEHKKQLQPS